MRFGRRPLEIDEVHTLALTWAMLNDGLTPSELALRAIRDAS